MPFLTTALAVAGIAASGAGVGESIANSAQASSSAQANQNVTNQELADKQSVFQQLDPFYSQYLGQGSPYLPMIQRAAAEQNAQQYGNAAGNLRQTMGTSGLGYGPSGSTAAALGQLGTQSANQSSNSYLSNLLNNEQVKFQAAQGLTGAGNMMSSQNTVGATPQPVQTTTGSSVNAFGQSLGNLLNPTGAAAGSNNNNGTLPLTPANPSNTTPITPSTTQGWTI